MESKDMQIMFPSVDPMTINGEQIIPKTFPFGKLPVVARAIGNMLEVLVTMPDNIEELLTVEGAKDPGIIVFFMGLIENCYGDVMELMSISTGKDRAWIEALDPADGFELLINVFMVNYDFFTKKFSPLFQRLMTKVSLLKISPTSQSSQPTGAQ